MRGAAVRNNQKLGQVWDLLTSVNSKQPFSSYDRQQSVIDPRSEGCPECIPCVCVYIYMKNMCISLYIQKSDVYVYVCEAVYTNV